MSDQFTIHGERLRPWDGPPEYCPTHIWKSPVYTRGERSFTRTYRVNILYSANIPGFYIVEGEGQILTVHRNELERVR